MTRRDRRRARRALLDLALMMAVFATAVLLAVAARDAMLVTGYQLAEEYSSFEFHPPEEQ